MGTLLQIRIDDNLKKQASEVFEKMGLDLSTAIRIFLKKSVLENGIPFDLKLQQTVNNFDKSLKKANDISKANGNSEMSLEEINKIISETRKTKE